MEESFDRSFSSLDEVFVATARFFDGLDIDEDVRRTVDFAIEEVFTNWVKYRPGATAPILIGLSVANGEVCVKVVDGDGEPFDLTRVPEPDVSAPLEERDPGGLGMHLVRQMMDRFEFEHRDGTSTVTMAKRLR